jgi:hypothetical protein
MACTSAEVSPMVVQSVARRSLSGLVSGLAQ